jgi:hypothetical protein
MWTLFAGLSGPHRNQITPSPFRCRCGQKHCMMESDGGMRGSMSFRICSYVLWTRNGRCSPGTHNKRRLSTPAIFGLFVRFLHIFSVRFCLFIREFLRGDYEVFGKLEMFSVNCVEVFLCLTTFIYVFGV